MRFLIPIFSLALLCGCTSSIGNADEKQILWSPSDQSIDPFIEIIRIFKAESGLPVRVYLKAIAMNYTSLIFRTYHFQLSI